VLVCRGCQAGGHKLPARHDDLRVDRVGSVQPQADRVISDMDKIDALMTQMINAPDASTFKLAYDQLDPCGATLLVDANAMRAALGLPPA
jgi:hypothetical protein